MHIAEKNRASLLDPQKFCDPLTTVSGDVRASVSLRSLKTLWINTGTLCNLTCTNCYIESSPTNDRLVYVTTAEVIDYLDEIEANSLGTEEIGFTGGEPFMNPNIIDILEKTLERGFRSLVLTNAMRPMAKMQKSLLRLRETYQDRLVLRVSIDHYDQLYHEMERGNRSWKPTIAGLVWLSNNGFTLKVAGRTFSEEDEGSLRQGYGRLFKCLGLKLNSQDPLDLVLFPEMEETTDIPEITTSCWEVLNVAPDTMMCANSRMVVKYRGAEKPMVVPCTLLPYDRRFNMGETLADAKADVPLNHPHCAKFCVLGGGTCSTV